MCILCLSVRKNSYVTLTSTAHGSLCRICVDMVKSVCKSVREDMLSGVPRAQALAKVSGSGYHKLVIRWRAEERERLRFLPTPAPALAETAEYW